MLLNNWHELETHACGTLASEGSFTRPRLQRGRTENASVTQYHQ